MKKYLDITTGKLNEVEDEEPAAVEDETEDKPDSQNRIIAINDDGLGSEDEEEADAYENVVRD